jgi:hypothetical protein
VPCILSRAFSRHRSAERGEQQIRQLLVAIDVEENDQQQSWQRYQG